MKSAFLYGVLLLAHGGAPEWNAEVAAIAKTVSAQAPVEVALGMADPQAMQKAVAALEARGCKKIVAVPLFINSRSEVIEQTRYALGINENPSEVMRQALAAMGHHGHGMMLSLERVKSKTPVVLTDALDEHPLVADILYDRAKRLSRSPAREIVVLVGHGPVDDDANRAWLRTIRDLSAKIQEKGRFKAVVGATLRDDAPKPVRDAAVAELRGLIGHAKLDGKVIVIPYLIARGGIEDKIADALKGLSYVWDGKTICPHPSVAKWVLETADAGAKKEDMRRFR